MLGKQTNGTEQVPDSDYQSLTPVSSNACVCKHWQPPRLMLLGGSAKRARERSKDIKGNGRETLKDTEGKTPHSNKCLKIKGRAKGRLDD